MERTELHVQMMGLVHAHDEESGLFVVYPNKLAFGVLVPPISGGDEAVASKMNLLLQLGWPQGTSMQFCLYGSPDLVGITTDYREMRTKVRDPLLRKLTDEHVEFMRQGAFKPIDPSSGIRLRDTRIAITVQIPFKGPAPTESDLRIARELRVGFAQTLKSAGMAKVDLTPKLYIRMMETILNQAPDSAWKQSPITTYDENEVICSQVLDPGNSIEVDKEGLWLNDMTRVRVLSPKRYPDFVYFGLAMRYLTDPKQGARGIRENAIVTLNLVFPEQQSERSKREKDQMWSTHQSSTPIAKYVKYFQERKRSLDAVLNQVEQGDVIVKGYIAMAIITQGTSSDPAARQRTEEKSVAATINAQSYWREFGFQMMQDRHMVAPFFSQLLPFGADPSMVKVLERYKTMSGRHATYLMPIMGQWRGTGSPVMTLFARDGQIQPISPWDTDTNMNFLVAAASGSGKSVFAQALIAAMRSIDARAWVIDVGESYSNLCESLGGQYIDFAGNANICINPFTLVQEFDEEVDMLAGIIAIMIAPTEGLGDFQASALKRTLKQVWNLKGREMTIDDLAAALKNSDRREISDMGEQLQSFTRDGEYGAYFYGRNSIAVDNPVTVLELGALKAKPHLQRVVLLTMMYQISQAVYMGDRSSRSMLLVDEAWQLLASDETADFIQRAYRQYRKHGASVGIISQSILDIWETKGGRAIADNSAHTYLLKQKSDSIDAVQREKKLPFGDWGYDMLKTVHTVQGEYSEIMSITPFGVGIGRLVLNNFQKVLFSTKAEDVAAVKAKRAAGMPLEDAINAIVRERYGSDSMLEISRVAEPAAKRRAAA